MAQSFNTGQPGSPVQTVPQLTATKGMSCEVKEYEARYEADGKRPVKEVVIDSPGIDEKDEGKSALRYYKYYTRHGSLETVTLAVQSSHIRKALREVIGSWPDQRLSGNAEFSASTVWEALACLFHYRVELLRYADNLENETARKHVQLVVNFISKELKPEITRFESNLSEPDQPSIDFNDIWMLFKPHDLVFGGDGPERWLNRVVKVAYHPGNMMCCPRWILTVKTFVHDGASYGYIHRQVKILMYKSTIAIEKLVVIPLKYHKDPEPFLDYLFARGKKYCDNIGTQYRGYQGSVTLVDRERTVNMSGRVNYTYPTEDIELRGRIVLDTKSYIQERTEADIKIHEHRDINTYPISEEDYRATHFVTAGFSLSEKRWGWFHVDSITAVPFDSGAFEALMLPPKQKRLIRALTTKTTSSNDGFDDLIQGKGKGCIFLLHGEPGIGKTFTAESIADDIKRPLYVMMSGELGSDLKTVDQNLRKVLKLVTAWKAVLLIDEADVFLEKRSSQNLERNSLVSIFLRVLEYFSGVLFLTTNRISSFDPAFQSRIHLALRYNSLDVPARAYLWQLFLQRTPNFDSAPFTDDAIADLASIDLNGRQIKNTVRTAHALALAEGEKLGVEQVKDVLETVTEFRSDFEKGRKINGANGVEGFESPESLDELEFTDVGVSNIG